MYSYLAAYLDDVVLYNGTLNKHTCHLCDFRGSGTEGPVLFLNGKLFERERRQLKRMALLMNGP